MNKDEIETLVSSYIEQSIQGLDKENPKFDFKRKWYNLKDPKEISEFLKDTTSIANTFGPDGYIVIGFDDDTKEFFPAKFSDSGLKDTSHIVNLVNGKVDTLFNINTIDIQFKGENLSIIHIPQSINKPHVIKKYITYDINGKEKKFEDNKFLLEKIPAPFQLQSTILI